MEQALGRDYYGDYYGRCYDWVKFAYTANDNELFTDDLCGCMDDPDHSSCDVENYPYITQDLLPSSTDDLNETLVGTDLKFIIKTDYSENGGKLTGIDIG